MIDSYSLGSISLDLIGRCLLFLLLIALALDEYGDEREEESRNELDSLA